MTDRSVDVGIVCALDLESSALVRRMGRRQKTIGSGFSVVRGIMGGRRVAVLKNDASHSGLASATDALLTVHRPTWLIAAGFAVGIDAQAKRGELIIANELVNDSEAIETTHTGATVAATLVAGTRTGRLVSITPTPRSSADKLQLSAQRRDRRGSGFMVVAKMASEHGVRFLAIRVLIDDAARDADPEARAVYHPSTSYRFGGVIGAFMSGRGHMSKVWKIRSTAKRHADRLGEFLAQLIPTLV